MVNPKLLCTRHLAGEHKELHQLVGHMNKGNLKVLQGHARLGQIQLRDLAARHEELVAEFNRRGWNHKSPLPEHDPLDLGQVDIKVSLRDLCTRCTQCRQKIEIAESVE